VFSPVANLVDVATCALQVLMVSVLQTHGPVLHRALARQEPTVAPAGSRAALSGAAPGVSGRRFQPVAIKASSRSSTLSGHARSVLVSLCSASAFIAVVQMQAMLRPRSRSMESGSFTGFTSAFDGLNSTVSSDQYKHYMTT
jgi:hypothetical protein